MKIRTERQRRLASLRALRFRARELDAKRILALRQGEDRDEASVYATDAIALRKVAKALFEKGTADAVRTIDGFFDTQTREEAYVAMVAGGALDAKDLLSATGRRCAKSLRTRMDRRGVLANVC